MLLHVLPIKNGVIRTEAPAENRCKLSIAGLQNKKCEESGKGSKISIKKKSRSYIIDKNRKMRDDGFCGKLTKRIAKYTRNIQIIHKKTEKNR